MLLYPENGLETTLSSIFCNEVEGYRETTKVKWLENAKEKNIHKEIHEQKKEEINLTRKNCGLFEYIFDENIFRNTNRLVIYLFMKMLIPLFSIIVINKMMISRNKRIGNNKSIEYLYNYISISADIIFDNLLIKCM